MWDAPVLFMSGGLTVSKWHFCCPRIYAAIDWAKAAKKFLESCATVRQALANIATHITTKGGQQAIEGIKQQMQTTVNTQGSSLWDQNPPPVNASMLVTGPGTTFEPINTRAMSADPEEVRRFIHMVAMVFGIPETFFADASTGSLATAQSLDRPTELHFLEHQERWRETLVTIAKHVLIVSAGAPSGKLSESLERRKIEAKQLRIAEAVRTVNRKGNVVYLAAAKPAKPSDIDVRVVFPAIREGDLAALVTAIMQAMTLGNNAGQIVGIDEKRGVLLLMETLGVENPEELIEEMYPDKEYEPDRTVEPEPAPLPFNAQPLPAGVPQAPHGVDPAAVVKPPATPAKQEAKEALRKLLEAVRDKIA